MARYDSEVQVTTSVLDRLIDYEPEVTREPAASRAKSLRLLKQTLRRDLEWLLNTRQFPDPVPSELKEVTRSVLLFGLPDFTTLNPKRPADQNTLRRELESAIKVFEPRLEGVVITLESGAGGEKTVRFKIDARLRIEPAPEPVSFDTFLEPSRGEFVVKGE
jgi:type VI secretion system protein ImpF